MEFYGLYYAATDRDGSTFLYSRCPRRDERFGQWKQGEVDASGLCGHQMIDRAVVRYEGVKPKWEDDPQEVYMTREEHELLFWEYTGERGKARQIRYQLRNRKK